MELPTYVPQSVSVMLHTLVIAASIMYFFDRKKGEKAMVCFFSFMSRILGAVIAGLITTVLSNI